MTCSSETVSFFDFLFVKKMANAAITPGIANIIKLNSIDRLEANKIPPIVGPTIPPMRPIPKATP